jgi:hypothetical protein
MVPTGHVELPGTREMPLFAHDSEEIWKAGIPDSVKIRHLDLISQQEGMAHLDDKEHKCP